MYAHRNGNGLMTNLDSISSSLSSIDTIGQRTNIKASADKLITTSRNHSIASASCLWRGAKTNGSVSRILSSNHQPDSEIYFNARRNEPSTCCLNLETALNFLLVPLLLLVITRQVFDFLGQIWLQIIINFFTILLIIVALFGIRQRRLSYVGSFTIWALFNTVWNLIVFCIHSKSRDVGITEDALSFFTGSLSWWHSNGPGCLPYNFNPNLTPTLSIIQPNIIPGCRLDYHLIESTQAIIHGILSFLAVLVSCCVSSNIHKEHSHLRKHQVKSFHLNNLTNERAKINQDPFPERENQRYGHSASLRRAANQTNSRSSQHSVASARRRNRHLTENAIPSPRESVSSMQRSQKYGSLSSRRSGRKERRSEISSLTYGTTGARSTNQRRRLSSMSSNDYLPSYQPPNSSSANLLSSYGEISSIDSYNNGQRASRSKTSNRSMNRGNTNPTYNGSRSSVCSQNATNYDDLSYIYGNNGARTNESLYGASTSGVDTTRHKRQIYQQSRSNNVSKQNRISDQSRMQPQKIHAEIHRDETNNVYQNGNAVTNPKTSMQNGNLHSFTVTNSRMYSEKAPIIGDYSNYEINNNQTMSNVHDESDKGGQTNGTFKMPHVPDNNRSRPVDPTINLTPGAANQNRIYSSQRSRHPIYSNQLANGDSETPI